MTALAELGSIWSIAAVFAAALVAGLMRGFAGFGSGMLMAPIFAVLFGPVPAVAIIVLMEVGVTAQLLPALRGDVEWRLVGPMGVAAALFMPVGSWLLVTVDATLMTRVMAAIVLVFVLVLAIGWRYRGRRRTVVTAAVGALSGTMMAATSMGNPPVMLYMLAGPDSAARSRANVTAYFAITLAALITVMLVSGLIGLDSVVTALLLLPVYMLAAWLGSRMFRASSERLYRQIALLALVAAALIGLMS